MVGLAEDFAGRLDRQCSSYLWHPAESVTLAGAPIYKFDDAGADFTLETAPAEPARTVNDKAVKN